MSEREPGSGRGHGVPEAIQVVGGLSFTLTVALVLLVHHYLTAFKCAIPR